MNEFSSKRREWVKNAAIVFLTVMLILTFFSNTIMNYSLPEVATQAVTSGTIISRVRGSGTLTVSEPYNVTIKESRVIKSVAVKKGDTVEKGAVLFELEDSDSKELKDAEAALAQLVLDYQKTILNGDTTLNKVDQIEDGKITDMTTMQQKVEGAKNAVKAAKDQVDAQTASVAAIQKQIDLLNNSTVDTSDEEDAVSSAKSKLRKAQSEQNKADVSKNSAEQKLIPGFGSTIDEIRKSSETKKDALSKAESELASDPTNSSLQLARDNALADFNNIDSALSEYDDAVSTSESAATKVTDCEAAVAEAEADLADKQNSSDKKEELASLNTQLIEANDELTKNNAALTKAQADQEDILKNVLEEVDLGGQNDKIREQQETVEKLKKDAVGATIVAPVAGTISNISRAAGETTTPDEALAVIQLADKGYSLSFSVTDQQAKTVKDGDTAELQDAWNHEGCTITLASIKPDPDKGGRSKILTFDVSGDVQEGEQLSISVGNKSANYDLIVPSSAIREDKNGKFILTVESKNSPLGNRYIATRVDIEVLASDDTQTAISAGLYGSEFVITTATKPVEAGKQVRLANN